MRVRRGRLVFEVDDEGPQDAPAVALLHGFPQDSACWEEVLPPLRAAGLRTIRFDQRGYSPGARPPERAAYRLEHLVADLLAVLDDREVRRCHLVGHDWGAVVGWAAAGQAPERVASLTAVSTPHPAALLRALRRPAQLLRSAYLLAFQAPVLPEALLRRHLANLLRRTGLPETHLRRYTARMREPGALGAALGWYRAVPLSHLRPPAIPVPTTLLWGREDPVVTRHAVEGTARQMRAPYELRAIAAGHWLPETRPAETAATVLRRVERSTP